MKYSGVGVFKHCYDDPNRITKFEERIVVTVASSPEETERKILAKFEEYSTDGVEFLDEYEIKGLSRVIVSIGNMFGLTEMAT